MTWLYDEIYRRRGESTPYSRLMVGYDRYGITIREWSDEVPEGEAGYTIQEGWFSWDTFRKRERCYSGDDGRGRMKQRIVAGAISLLAYYGGSSDDSGIVPSLRHYLNGGHLFTC